ncbi:DAK2 domain-containing protein [Nocardioides panacihumi]|uniref:DAK2 domain-containing protein n=1 Tax=Nocardioides panacihumi TaxID=400774 RepID=A0ABP5CG24_9ACTN
MSAARPLDLAVVARFAELATDALGAAREEIDALNVYPVPDGDTGTNMFLTLSAARDALQEAGDRGRTAALEAFAKGALLGARGNSGVILAEILGAVVRRLARQAEGEPTAVVVAEALGEATEASYAAVGTPVEGTILTVLRAAGEAAMERAKGPEPRTGEVLCAAAAAAREALARTPDQLPVLRDAGVVDAGGRGLTAILDAAETALTGRRPSPVAPTVTPHRTIPTPHPGAPVDPGGPSFEVMYLLDAPADTVASLRERLAALGESLVITGSDGLWNVHVHVDDAGAALEAGVAAGRPHRIRVTHLQASAQAPVPTRTGRKVVAMAAGPGLRALFEDAGAVVVDGGPGMRPAAGQLLEAIRRSGAAEVVVLPNDSDTVRAAAVAARTAEADDGIRVAVVPSHAQVQGLAAMAVHEPGRSFDGDVLEMTATARHARHGAVTVAAKRAMTMAGACEVGDALGVVDGDFVVVGDDLAAVATDVLGRLLGAGGELVTVVCGAHAEAADLARACSAWVEEHHPTVDVMVYDGGQDRYPLLMCVE